MRTGALRLVGEPPPRAAPSGGAIAQKGFRPFFLLAGLFAAALVPIWLLALAGLAAPGAYFDPMYWHAHEMLFGFAAAVIAGFLLTAVSNWTGRDTLVGWPLLALAALWLAGRVSLLVPGLPPAVVALLDLAFLPCLAIAIARPLAGAKNRRNYVMVVVLLALSASNLATHLDVLGILPGWRRRGALLGVDIVVLLIVIIAGRVVPMFTKNGTGATGVRSHAALDRAAIAATALVLVADLVQPGGVLGGIGAVAAAALTAARAVPWAAKKVWHVPLLWVLHAGYAWIPIGFALRAAARFSTAIPEALATHALTVGAIGTVVLGMMARVSLGHTGRALEVGRVVTAAFALVLVAACVRVLGPLVVASSYRATLHVAGAAWTAAYAIFVVAYGRLLVSPRADRKPG